MCCQQVKEQHSVDKGSSYPALSEVHYCIAFKSHLAFWPQILCIHTTLL